MKKYKRDSKSICLNPSQDQGKRNQIKGKPLFLNKQSQDTNFHEQNGIQAGSRLEKYQEDSNSVQKHYKVEETKNSLKVLTDSSTQTEVQVQTIQQNSDMQESKQNELISSIKVSTQEQIMKELKQKIQERLINEDKKPKENKKNKNQLDKSQNKKNSFQNLRQSTSRIAQKLIVYRSQSKKKNSNQLTHQNRPQKKQQKQGTQINQLQYRTMSMTPDIKAKNRQQSQNINMNDTAQGIIKKIDRSSHELNESYQFYSQMQRPQTTEPDQNQVLSKSKLYKLQKKLNKIKLKSESLNTKPQNSNQVKQSNMKPNTKTKYQLNSAQKLQNQSMEDLKDYSTNKNNIIEYSHNAKNSKTKRQNSQDGKQKYIQALTDRN